MNNNYFKVDASAISREGLFHFDDANKASAQRALQNAQEYRDICNKQGKITVYRSRGFGVVRGVRELGSMPREARPATNYGHLIGVPKRVA